MFTVKIETEIQITASLEAIWAVLTDFATYPDWNPFIRRIEGQAEVGGRLRIELSQSPDAAPMRFSPRVLAAEPPRALRWLGRVVLPGLLDGEHSFRLLAAPGGETRFQQSERFSGILVPLVRAKLETDTLKSFNAMNDALKSRVEACSPDTAAIGGRSGDRLR